MRPTSKMVYERLMILYFVVRHAETHPLKDFFDESIKPWPDDDKKACFEMMNNDVVDCIETMKFYNLWGKTTNIEKYFLTSFGYNMNEQAHLDAMWRRESAGMLLWALNFIPDWPSLDNEIEGNLYNKIVFRKINLFTKIPKLRNKQEINKKTKIN